jgi:hypothetical protein
MNKEFWKIRTKYLPALIVVFSLSIGAPALWAQQDKDPLKAWATIQQTVKDMETAVQSKDLHGIHEPSMKIRPAIRTLKGHSSMLSEDKAKNIGSALQQLDSAVTDLHSAADEGSQAKSETALKSVESAFDQLKTEDPGAAFKNMH